MTLEEVVFSKYRLILIYLETVVGKDSSQIGMSVEVDTIHVPDLALEPVGRGVDVGGDWVDRVQLVSIGLDANASIVVNWKQIPH